MTGPVVLASNRFSGGSGGRVSRWRRAAMSAAIIAVAAACGPAPAPAVDNSTTVTTAPTTRTPRIVDDSGRPDVTFDPCLDLPDDVMTEAGYDAAHKEFADMPMGWYTFLGCTYRDRTLIPGVRRGYGLNILAGNVSIDEELEKNGSVATAASINGRRALLEVDPNNRDTCTYVLQTEFGIAIFSRIYHKDHPGPVPQNEWCTGFEDFVSTLEPYI
ncbi:DUF3558 domain-containing protein [Rhodococcus sp. F64268]|uniref:DUF3558 domain-containing protein n=1 Tax=Rhodococcus sp. F64268 TaxID=2926402 RepID=UPI0027E03FF9|nr:DUF3558 domain-containing protein [Rhodococcus sp. F64268]